MKNVIAILIFIIGVLLGCYFGGWVMFIKPIIDCLAAFDAGVLTGMMVGITIIKCLFATTVGIIIVWVGAIVAAIIGNM